MFLITRTRNIIGLITKRFIESIEPGSNKKLEWLKKINRNKKYKETVTSPRVFVEIAVSSNKIIKTKKEKVTNFKSTPSIEA